MIEAKVSGLSKLKEMLILMTSRMSSVTSAAMYLEGQNIMTVAKELTPVDVGTLKGSGYVTEPQHRFLRGEVITLGFGGPAEAYAMVQHEHTEFHHEVGEAKFLEKAVNAFKTRFQKDIALIANRLLRESKGRRTVTLPVPLHPVDPWGGF